MVCQDCEKKLSKVIVPDKWKDGARNVTGGTDGGRATTYRNSLLQVRGKTQRFTAGVKSCRICRQKVAQDANYCQICAHHNGICAMCGKRVDDLRFDRRGGEAPKKRQKTVDVEEKGDYGTSERFKEERAAQSFKEREAAAAAADGPVTAPAPAPAEEDPLAERAKREAEKASSAMNSVEAALARSQGRTINDGQDASKDYSKWASARDAGSGKTYYYNSETRETSWVWPPRAGASQAEATDAEEVKKGGMATMPWLEPRTNGMREGMKSYERKNKQDAMKKDADEAARLRYHRG
mmetsp:Transcript_24778/g.74328  ORF Transcript_24778/g.74328 Transcript_24778/m.74328 type:complete len:295 (-) Transcript_24778:27-911(-)